MQKPSAKAQIPAALLARRILGYVTKKNAAVQQEMMPIDFCLM
tara:strand:+ start:511 stop:639 length:129 start_codon:yes stop_codon:yes gene_type:complete